MTDPTDSAIFEPLAQSFAKAHAAFVDAVRAAIAGAVGDPLLANTPAFLTWQTQALPMLERQNASIEKALALFLVGETRTILSLAADCRGLAKQLDGYPLTFAGADPAANLERLETAEVVAAYRLCAAAGIP